MLSIIPAFLIFLSSFLQDPSGSWIPSAESTTSNVFFKSKYISKIGSKITIWVKFSEIIPLEIEIGGKKKSYTLLLEECDCNNYSLKTLSSNSYTESGEVIGTYNYKDAEVTYAPPGSVGYRYISDICTRFNKKKK